MHVSWILEMLGEKCLFQVICPIQRSFLYLLEEKIPWHTLSLAIWHKSQSFWDYPQSIPYDGWMIFLLWPLTEGFRISIQYL